MKSMGRTFRKRKGIKRKHAHSCLSQDFIDLSKWMKIKTTNKLIPAIFIDTGRGLMTKKSISEGETIIAIPKTFLITMETILQSDISSWIKSSPLKLNLQQAMSIFLLVENNKGRNSKWWLYIKVLPTTYDTPAFWTSNDINLFSNNLFPRIIKEIKDFQTFYDEVVKFLSYCCDFVISYEDFRWAWYCINSRSIYYINDVSPYFQDRNKDIALAPFLDLLNHSTTAVVDAAFNKSSNCYEIKTHKSYKKYDQVFISYGPHNNIHLLLEYGFILPDNPHDVYEIDFDTIQRMARHFNMQYIDKKNTLIVENELDKKLVCSLDGISWNFQAMLRIVAMDFTELKSWKVVFNGIVISVKNEQLVKQMSGTILQEELAKVRTGFDKFPYKDYTRLTTHQKMAYDLLKIEENILLKSINLL